MSEIRNLESKITTFNKSCDASLREKELIDSYYETKLKSNKNTEVLIFTTEASIKNLDI